MARQSEDQSRTRPRATWSVVLVEADAPRGAPAPLTARAVKAEHRVLGNIADALLEQVQLIASGDVLQRRDRYIDLHDPLRGDFPGDDVMRPRPGRHIIARSRTPSAVWNAILDEVRSLFARGGAR